MMSVTPKLKTDPAPAEKSATLFVDPTPESDRVFAHEPTGVLVVVSGAVIIQAGLRIKFASGIAKAVDQIAGRGDKVPEAVISVGVRQSAGRVAERSQRAQPVGLIEARCGAAQHRQRLVDVESLRVTGNGGTRRACFLDKIVAVVGVNARA
jgi:hypothetical protein